MSPTPTAPPPEFGVLNARPPRTCSLVVDTVQAARAQHQIEQLKQQITFQVMVMAGQRGYPIATLIESLLQSAASAIASAIVLDEATKVLCSKSEADHVQLIAARLVELCQLSLTDARQQMLKPNLVLPTSGAVGPF